MAATRAFRLIPVSATARLSTSRWVGVRSSGVLQKERMVRPLRQRPVRAGRKGEAGVRAGEATRGRSRAWGLSKLPPNPPRAQRPGWCRSRCREGLAGRDPGPRTHIPPPPSSRRGDPVGGRRVLAGNCPHRQLLTLNTGWAQGREPSGDAPGGPSPGRCAPPHAVGTWASRGYRTCPKHTASEQGWRPDSCLFSSKTAP